MTNRQIFGFFDQAYVINLDKDHGRLRRFRSRASAIGIPDVIRVKGVTENPHPKKKPFKQPGNHGLCALSHIRTWQAVLANGHRHAVIFEDDALFRDDAGMLLKHRIVPQLATLQRFMDWDIFYLGCSLSMPGEDVGPDIAHAVAAGHSHAYAISAAGCRKLIPFVKRYIYEQEDFWDSLLLPGITRLYSKTLLAIQEPGMSNTADKHIDRVYWYFRNGYFSRAEFESHCTEMQGWQKGKK